VTDALISWAFKMMKLLATPVISHVRNNCPYGTSFILETFNSHSISKGNLSHSVLHLECARSTGFAIYSAQHIQLHKQKFVAHGTATAFRSKSNFSEPFIKPLSILLTISRSTGPMPPDAWKSYHLANAFFHICNLDFRILGSALYDQQVL